jgi:hypothetical protein
MMSLSFGQAELFDDAAHDELVLCVDQGIRLRLDIDTLANQGLQVLGGDVFVVEGHHIQALGELAQRVQILVVADRSVSHGRDRGDVFCLGQDTEFEAKGYCTGGHHAG